MPTRQANGDDTGLRVVGRPTVRRSAPRHLSLVLEDHLHSIEPARYTYGVVSRVERGEDQRTTPEAA
jgi:hypothetical protein